MPLYKPYTIKCNPKIILAEGETERIAVRPPKAIKIECRLCNGGASGCQSAHCVLWRKDIPILQRIKQHCINCAPDNKPEECNGRIILGRARSYIAAGCAQGPDGPYGMTAICPLYPWRYGKNPNKARVMTEEQRQRLIAAGAPYRKAKK